MDVDVAGRIVSVTSPDKVMFPEQGQTKLDLVDYYRSVEDELMGAIRGRPVLLQRFPNGAGTKGFWQKQVPAHAPEWVTRWENPEADPLPPQVTAPTELTAPAGAFE